MINFDKEVIAAVERFLDKSTYEEYKSTIGEFWDKLEEENPYLYELIGKMCKGYLMMEDKPVEERLELIDTFAHGLFTLYFSILKQEEITEMNEHWGL